MAAVLEQRFVRPTLYGAAFTFAMFWSMHLLIAGGKCIAEKGDTLATVDFVRLKKDTDLQERERKKPIKPEPPKQPPPPKMKVDVPPPDSQPVPFNMPKLNLPTNVSGGPFLGAVTGDMSGYSELVPLVRIQPQYPRAALRDGISGYVDFSVTIAPDGTVRSARPLKAQPRGVFEAAALQAIMKWKFKPKVEDGKPIETTGTYRMKFTLEGEGD